MRISQIKIKYNPSGDLDGNFYDQDFRGTLKERLLHKAGGLLRIPADEIKRFEIVRESIDARKKPEIYLIYTVDVLVEHEERLLRRQDNRHAVQITRINPMEYRFPDSGVTQQENPTVIVGTGPAGLFCGYFLALHGYRPILLERGRAVEERQADVERFWETGKLRADSNVQFGEGGAGTFSDGKLNTLVKDKDGRNRAVLQVFVDCGAKEEILYQAKPHIGTDVLCKVVRRMREEIIQRGGEVRFGSRVTDIDIQDGRVCGVSINGSEHLACNQLVLAVGHSARDTFSMLHQKGIPMEAKAFAVGLRVEHPQDMINESQYGVGNPVGLGAAPYKVTAQADNGRGVYSFCMCPGGYVVNASSEEKGLAVNGMSYSNRDGRNANSAIIVAVTPEDFGSEHPLAGVEFQRGLERRAYALADGKIPMQRYGVYKACVEHGKTQEELLAESGMKLDALGFYENGCGNGRGNGCENGQAPGGRDLVEPQNKGLSTWADVSAILPRECNEAFVQGMEAFGKMIDGFNRPDAILSGVESRTSSPLRILRDQTMQSEIRGLYPCGEGAGYAGGITSAAMDGIRVAEAIASQFAPRK